MAIIKVSQFNSAPTAVSDYEAQNAHIMAFINQVNSQAFILTNPTGTTEPTIKQDTYINHGGTLYTVDTADETITGSPADGNVYIKLSVSGDNLIASYVTDISAYTWNQVYGYLASGTDIILPYLLVKSGTSWTKYRMDIKTPQYVTDQNLRTTDAVTFATVNTGQGANELYAMNQAVRTTDDVVFNTNHSPFLPIDEGLGWLTLGNFSGSRSATGIADITAYSGYPPFTGTINVPFTLVSSGGLSGDTKIYLYIKIDGTTVYTSSTADASTVTGSTTVTLDTGNSLEIILNCNSISSGDTMTWNIDVQGKRHLLPIEVAACNGDFI